MTRTIKNIIALVIIYTMAIAGYMVVYNYFDWDDTNPGRIGVVGAEAATDEPGPEECPAGSYPISGKNEELICKLEPTGCPYGDSIPLEFCDKFKPAEPEVVHEEQPVIRGK